MNRVTSGVILYLLGVASVIAVSKGDWLFFCIFLAFTGIMLAILYGEKS